MRWLVAWGDTLPWLVLVVWAGCTAYRDCPPEAADAVEAVTREWPDVATILEDTDVICVDEDPYPDVPCVYDWYGSPLARGRMTVRKDLAGPCVVHEAMHARLSLTGDDCRDHGACWDHDEVARVTDEVTRE